MDDFKSKKNKAEAEHSKSASGNEAKDVEEGELPEEGEIMDDEEEKTTQPTIFKDQKPYSAKKQQNQMDGSQKSRTPVVEDHQLMGPELTRISSSSFVENRQPSLSIARVFHRGSWQKSFGLGGHHGAGGRFSNRGGSANLARYRDFDGRVAMNNMGQQDDEMFGSWNDWIKGGDTHHYRYGAGRGAISPSGDISPIRTSPMLEEEEVKLSANGIQSRHVPPFSSPPDVQIREKCQSPIVAKQTEPMSGALAAPQFSSSQQHQLEDDRDYRAIGAIDEMEDGGQSSSFLQYSNRGGSPEHCLDDNDFRRSNIRPQQAQHMNRQISPTASFAQGRFVEENRRRHRSQSPQQAIEFGGSHFSQNSTHFDDLGPSVKRNRTLYGSGHELTQRHNFEHKSTPSDDASWSSPGRGRPHFHRGGGVHGSDFHPHPAEDRGGGRGGRTQGWGYRGGRPFLPRLICKFFREGYCRDGERCTFSHSTGDSHRRPELCKYYQQGFCKKSLFCQLMHGEWPCKAFHKGECTKEQCMFSHQPLDEVSRPILDKMLEEEKLGLDCPPPNINNKQQLHQPMSATPSKQFPGNSLHHQQSHLTGNAFFHMNRFQTPQQQHLPAISGCQQISPPSHSFHSAPAMVQTPTNHIIRPHHQPQGLPAQYQPALFKNSPHQAFTELRGNEGQIPAFGIIPENLQQGETSLLDVSDSKEISNEEMDATSQHHVSNEAKIPPPGLVMPPLLCGNNGTPLALPQAAPALLQHQQPGVSSNFGFFNPVSSSGTGTQRLPPPSFQELQQQIHQQVVGPIGPHFPHQPSLLGPSCSVGQILLPPPLNSMSNQIIEPKNEEHYQYPPHPPQIKSETDENFVVPPNTSIKNEPSAEESHGGFNINRMLEQITRQQSPPQLQSSLVSSDNAQNRLTDLGVSESTVDLFTSVGLICAPDSGLAEDSPASPTFGIEQGVGGENKPAALIPVIREWKLQLVDLPPPAESSEVQFDIKLVQQISSSNSDPRLRKIAEKQFDLVSKTLEKHQEASQKKSVPTNEEKMLPDPALFPWMMTSSTNKKYHSSPLKKEEEESVFGNESCEKLIHDPRTRDPRRSRFFLARAGPYRDKDLRDVKL